MSDQKSAVRTAHQKDLLWIEMRILFQAFLSCLSYGKECQLQYSLIAYLNSVINLNAVKDIVISNVSKKRVNSILSVAQGTTEVDENHCVALKRYEIYGKC